MPRLPLPEGLTFVKSPARDAVADNAPVEKLVAEILARVEAEGDPAVRDYSARFDKAELESFEVTAE